MSLKNVLRHLIPTAKDVDAVPVTPTKMLYKPNVESGWDDADAYTTPGTAVGIPSAITAKSVANLPCIDSGLLRVYGSLSNDAKDLVQVYECYTVGGWWVRRCVAGTWSPWSPTSGVQSGSTDSGSWIKWPEGTMLQWGEVLGTTDSGGYLTAAFPVPFITAPGIFTVTGSDGSGIVERGVRNSTSGKILFRNYSDGSVRAGKDGRLATWLAIGRWR